MGVIAPAMAEPTNTGTFPSNGLMQEDYKYTNAATAENMDTVYEGNVNAIAEYTEIPYSAAEGFYLTGVDNNNDAITAECTSGNFCPGVASTTYENNAFGDTGLQSCSTATSGAYTLSDAGASSSGQCYRTCDGNVSILHATGVTGNDYSDGTNTCAPTACENGYHPKAAVPAPNLTSLIGVSEAGTKSAYKSNSGTGNNSSASDLSTYGITQNGEFVVDYGNKGKIHGHAQCSTQSGQEAWNYSTDRAQNPTITTTLPDSAGQYCYCQLDSYTTSGGVVTALSAPWVFISDVGAGACANLCATECGNKLRYGGSDSLAFRAAMFDSVQSSPAMCEANVININWNDVDEATAGQNNEGTAVYGEDVRTPFKAQTKKGKTFRGWRFSKPEQTNLP